MGPSGDLAPSHQLLIIGLMRRTIKNFSPLLEKASAVQPGSRGIDAGHEWARTGKKRCIEFVLVKISGMLENYFNRFTCLAQPDYGLFNF
jgi:hypothetical protein